MLRSACAADALARLSVLHRACGQILYWDREDDTWIAEWKWRRPLEQGERYRENPLQDLAGQDERELHFAWRLAKCRAVPSAAMKPIERVRPPYLGNILLDVYDQSISLRVIAARLGSVWANTQVGHRTRQLNATAKEDLTLAYIGRSIHAALGVETSEWMRLPFLLAAKAYDLQSKAPKIDWSELPLMYSESDIEAAQAVARDVVQNGWQPMPESSDRDLTWPWAIAPPVVETRFIARRYDRYGNIRWVYPGGSEYWFGHDGSVQQAHLDSDLVVTGHTQISTAGLVERRWRDADGNERWADKLGHEHWTDESGAEHWVDWGGTEWVLLPIGDPLPTRSASN